MTANTLLERNESGRVRGTDTGATVLDGLAVRSLVSDDPAENGK